MGCAFWQRHADSFAVPKRSPHKREHPGFDKEKAPHANCVSSLSAGFMATKRCPLKREGTGKKTEPGTQIAPRLSPGVRVRQEESPAVFGVNLNFRIEMMLVNFSYNFLALKIID